VAVFDPHPDGEAFYGRAGIATRTALLVTAERMFGDLGIDAVSLLAIVREAGQGNKNAVQYHFGSKEGLVSAILVSRSEQIERRRAELLVGAGAAGLLADVPTLVGAMYRPVIEQVDRDGRYTFARFLVQYLNYPGFPEEITRPPDIARREQTVTNQLKVLLERAIPHLTAELVEWRVLMQLRLLVACLVESEKARERGAAGMTRHEVVRDTLQMVTAALSAPV
jgi:AcrR family transcriptional regulator